MHTSHSLNRISQWFSHSCPLSQEDFEKLVHLLRLRPLRFCTFLTAWFGEERMEQSDFRVSEPLKPLVPG